jgi:hypothetical protein
MPTITPEGFFRLRTMAPVSVCFFALPYSIAFLRIEKTVLPTRQKRGFHQKNEAFTKNVSLAWASVRFSESRVRRGRLPKTIVTAAPRILRKRQWAYRRPSSQKSGQSPF